MTDDQFQKVCRNLFTHRMNIMNAKGKSRLAGTQDRLIMFKRLAALEQRPPQEVCISLCAKHFSDLINISQGKATADLGCIVELISDIQNYLDLLNALWQELANNQGEPNGVCSI